MSTLLRTNHCNRLNNQTGGSKMKRTIGWVLLVIVGLNFVTILVRISQEVSIGSPLYLIILTMMFLGGLHLINSKNQAKPTSEAGVNQDD